ncbi:hypothetical protein CARUB_v10014911mg [Capsella rubella]|uniref:Uncharacterized protein n=1 Tax=Capsella rubella TaxID=81985 RepID=R0I1D3_9BRAS|nr:chalcone synthase 4 [Capsella rubella]EOA31705.1 hypothetical protein CARUB_v10014911mg [Capsella rubella]
MSDNWSTVGHAARHLPALRQVTMVIPVSELSGDRQQRATEQWAIDNSTLTHLVFCITSRHNRTDHGPNQNFDRLISTPNYCFVHYQYQQGWYDEGTAIRLCRDFSRDYDPALGAFSQVTTPIFREGASEDW